MASARWHRYSRSRGFTLIEVLVAGMILAFAAAAVGIALSHGYVSLADGRDERRAALLLDDLLTKIDLIGPNRIASEGPRRGSFDGQDQRFSWSLEIRSRPVGHLYEVDLTLSWSDGGRGKSARLQTYLNDPPNSRDSTLKWDAL